MHVADSGETRSLCEHCDALNRVLTELMGGNVAAVIMRRAKKELHGEGRDELASTPLPCGQP